MRTFPRALSCAALAAFWLSAASPVAAAPFDINCGGATNVDTNPATIVTCSVGEIGTITDLNVVLNIDEATANAYATDLQINLVHLATATSVAVYVGSEVINPQSVMDATFDDAAASAPPGSGDIIGTFLSSGLLSAFNGLSLAGDWNLEILDASAYPNEGIDLIEWRLVGAHVPEPGSAALLAAGLLGLAVLSGRKHGTGCPGWASDHH